MCEMCPNTEFFLVRTFPHSDWVRRDTSYLSVLSPNAGKYRSEKTPYLDSFHAVVVHSFLINFTLMRYLSIKKLGANLRIFQLQDRKHLENLSLVILTNKYLLKICWLFDNSSCFNKHMDYSRKKNRENWVYVTSGGGWEVITNVLSSPNILIQYGFLGVFLWPLVPAVSGKKMLCPYSNSSCSNISNIIRLTNCLRFSPSH